MGHRWINGPRLWKGAWLILKGIPGGALLAIPCAVPMSSPHSTPSAWALQSLDERLLRNKAGLEPLLPSSLQPIFLELLLCEVEGGKLMACHS